MKVLKGFGVGILSFILFLSLTVFGTAFMLKSTLLNPDFVASEADKVPLSTAIRELTEAQVGNQLPQELFFLKEAVYQVISDQEPWLKKQLRAAIYASYDFFLGKTDRLSLTISLEALKSDLRDSLWQSFNKNLPPALSSLPQAQLKAYFDQYYSTFAGQIPSQLTLDQSMIPSDAMPQLILARQYIGYFQTYYYVLIGFMVLLVLLIILITRSVRDATRSLGIDLLIYGAIEFAGVYIARNYAATILPEVLPLRDIPSSLQTWLMGLPGDLLAPLQTFSLGILVGGVILLVVSFVYKSSAAED